MRDDISPRNISGTGCGARVLPHVIGNIVATSDEIIMKEKILFSMFKCYLSNSNKNSKMLVKNKIKRI